MILSFSKFNQQTKKKTLFETKIINNIKRHTIRAGSRWRPGQKIHFATGVRTKKYKQFAMGEVTAVQTIQIFPLSFVVLINHERLSEIQIKLLAINDGFDTVKEFWQWFSSESMGQFKGQLIHWKITEVYEN